MKRLLFVVLVILLGTMYLSSQTLLDKGNELFKQKDYKEAAAQCLKYLTDKPKDELGWVLLAKTMEKLGNLDSAEHAGQRAIQLDDELMEGYTILAYVQYLKKQCMPAYNTALSGLKMTRRKQPKYPPLLVVYGQALMCLDSADAAQIAASEAKVLDPMNPTAYEVIGDSYAKQGVTPMAIMNYEKSIEVDSMQPDVLYKLANTYKADRQYTEAARIYSKILTLDPTNQAARLELGQLLFRAKQYAKSVAVLKEYMNSVKNPPKEVQEMYLEGLFHSRQYREALDIGQEFLKTEPNSPLALRAIAYGYFNEHQYQKSIDAFDKLAKVDTLRFDDYRWLGGSYRQLKKDSLAAAAYEEAVKDTTQQTNILSYLLGEIGTIWMNFKQYERAASFFEKRLQIDSMAVGASINYAICMMQVEKFEAAANALKRAIELNPKYPASYINLGFCYYQQKDYETGMKEFEEAIKVIDTAEVKYRVELADANRMIALAIMIEKKATIEESQKKWETAATYLRKSLKYKEDVAQTHLLLGQCYQNLNKKEDAIKEYKRTLQLDPKNEQAKKGLKDLQPE